jgi:short-subunit dehydrogenase
MKAARTKKAEISITNILPGYVKTDIIIGDTFWMSTVEKATGQIFKAIKNKKRKAYVTKRWRIIAVILKILPARTLIKYF